MGKDEVVAFRGKEEVVDALREFLREKAVLMLQAAVEAEAEEFVARYADRRDEHGRRQVVRNGYLPQREIVTGIGALKVTMPRVRDESGDGLSFRSNLVPAYVRRAKSVDALLPWLYLKGIAAGEIEAALQVLLGKQAKNLSGNVVGRLKAKWSQKHAAWAKRDLSKDNTIESSFATIRHRTDRTKGAVSRSTLLGLVYKLAMCAEKSFRRLNGFEQLAEVIRGVKFVDGVRAATQQQKIAA